MSFYAMDGIEEEDDLIALQRYDRSFLKLKNSMRVFINEADEESDLIALQEKEAALESEDEEVCSEILELFTLNRILKSSKEVNTKDGSHRLDNQDLLVEMLHLNVRLIELSTKMLCEDNKRLAGKAARHKKKSRERLATIQEKKSYIFELERKIQSTAQKRKERLEKKDQKIKELEAKIALSNITFSPESQPIDSYKNKKNKELS